MGASDIGYAALDGAIDSRVGVHPSMQHCFFPSVAHPTETNTFVTVVNHASFRSLTDRFSQGYCVASDAQPQSAICLSPVCFMRWANCLPHHTAELRYARATTQLATHNSLFVDATKVYKV